jgi:hypothetical protein
MSEEIEFKIDVWTPGTIPQARLGLYLVELARLYGEADSVHFSKMLEGSLRLISEVQETARPKIERRLALVKNGEAPKDAVDAYKNIDSMLAEDNATAVLKPSKALIIAFPGRNRPKPVEFGPVREEGFLEGEIVRIGGRDKSVHVILQDGDAIYSNIETNRDIARELGKHLFGPIVRLWGTGVWLRSGEGVWTLERFAVGRFEVMGERRFADALGEIRAVQGSEWNFQDDPVAALLAGRSDEGAGRRKTKRKSP